MRPHDGHSSSLPVDPTAPPVREWSIVRRLLPYLWPREEPALRRRVVLAFVCLLAARLTSISVPWLYKQAVDTLTPGHSAVLVVPLGLLLAYGSLRFLQQLFTEAQDLVFDRVTEFASRIVSLKIFRHLFALSLRFHLDRRTGGLSRTIERGTRGIEIMLRMIFFRAGPSVLELIFVSIILGWALGWAFALVTILTLVAYAAFTIAVTEWRLAFRRAMNQTDAEANARAIDSIINYETVKYFSNEEHEAHRYGDALQAYERATLKSKASLAGLNLGQGGIIGIGLVVLMVLAAHGVARGTMTVGDFVMVNSYLIQLALPLNFLGMVYREVKQSLADMEQMFGLLDQVPEVADKPGAQPLAIRGGEIAFEDVHFSYDANPSTQSREILKGISFCIKPGQSLAIVGASGAGKSTIARLLFRFFDVSQGRITIDGQDIRNLTQNSVRAAIGVVPQDTVLFNETIAYNIAYGRPGATQEEIERAAERAAIHRFISTQPTGYLTRVGERGLKLSGGEKQRVAIARTILKNPPILILDEATSALDTHTERDIQAALADVSRHRTTLMIAHRLSTVVDADEIIVLEAGRIAERGNHAALLAHNGLYAGLWQHQHQEAATISPVSSPDAAF